MAQNFLSCDRDQEFLLPPSLREWLPVGHLAWFVIDAVAQIDLSAFYADYRDDGWGRPAHDPAAMVALLLYAYAVGERSSRRIERRCVEDVAFRVIMAGRVPDHVTIARFRARHEGALSEVFVEVLRLCQESGLLSVGVVALDGTKIQANASLGANRTYEWICSQVEGMLSEAAETDAREDARYGEARGDELPPELADRERRLERLRAAKEKLEGDLEEQQIAHRVQAEQRAQREATLPAGKRLRGAKPAAPPQAVAAEAKVNLTDPESRAVKQGFRYFQGYNAQAAVAEGQIVVAAELTDETTDHHQLEPMIEATDEALRQIAHPHPVGIHVADSGYWTDHQVGTAIAQGRRVLVKPQAGTRTSSTSRERPVKLGQPAPGRLRGLRRLMTELFELDECREVYERRRVLVEPVFAQTKITRGIQRFQRRGRSACLSEWRLIAATHNLVKLWRNENGAPSPLFATG